MIFYYWLVGILPLMQHPIWGRKIGPLTVFEYIGVICFAYALVHIFSRPMFPPYLGTWETRLVVLLYLIALFSSLTKGRGVDLGNGPLIIYTSSLFLIFISISIVDTLRRLRRTVLALVGSYGFASLFVIREWQQNHGLYSNFRPGWMVGDSNYFSTTAIFAIVLAFYFMQEKRSSWEKIFCGVCLVLTIVASTLCASRGGFLGLTAAALLLVWSSKRRVRNLILMSALILPLSLALPMSPLHRFLTPHEDYGSTQAHLEAWKAGEAMIKAHPFTGVGLGNFKPLMPRYVEAGTNITVDTLAHNMYIEVAAELGLPALLVFLGIICFTYRSLVRLRKAPSTHPLIRRTASALQAGLVGFAVAGSFVSAEYQKTSWMGFALMFCLMPLARSQKLAKKVPVPAPVAAGEEAVLSS
ncbi:MAG TPA: O-antigen ligase family protein [Candidatus Dormibacteraeota bacterium]|nr:O-antigen ligase family protein [Candidatus Dormibacteraeota bacterium]